MSSRKSSDSFLLLILKKYRFKISINTIEEQANQSMKFIFEKPHFVFVMMFFFWNNRKINEFCYLGKKIRILKNSTGFPFCLYDLRGRVPLSSYAFMDTAYNSIHPITTGMNPIRNMNHKKKYLLNQLQEYQLQYLLSKEESFQ